MIFTEKNMSLFDVPEYYFLAHCISSDYAMGAGIAVEMAKRFNLRNLLEKYGDHNYPDAVLASRVINLVTKDKYYDKPTYYNLNIALQRMNILCKKYSIEYLAMPKIGCGLDRLQWNIVEKMIQETFRDTNIEILICSL